MKKIITMAVCTALIVVIFAGCGKQAETADGKVKTGLAVVTSLNKSADTGENEGLAQADSTVVAVTVDNTGKIVKCVIDAAQTRINFSPDGKITTPLDTVFQTKQELGADYGMGNVSGIKKEWNEQANAFAKYVEGKTLTEVKGIAVNEGGAPTGSELTSSVTIHVTDFIAAIEKAVNNAKDLGANAGDKLGLGIVTTIDKSTDAGADKEGLAQAYSTYTAATFGPDGKITSCIIDSSQSNVNFNASGEITTDLNSEQKTKNEIGDEYGMKKVSGIQKEWNEQAAAFADYVKGKSIKEVKGIAVSEAGVPAGSDLTASVTISITDFIQVIEKAAANAK
ncbi:MAG: hypothetical protein ACOX4M_10140 [Acetivibrionales bacterium]|jgi:hypothetical protein